MQPDIESTQGQETILVVEDEILVRMVIADYLRKCGYTVLETATGEQAMAALREPGAKVDIVFSDVEMPGTIDGFALAKWIRSNRPDIEVILTGSAKQTADAAGKLCDDGPLPKPYHPQNVLDRIRRIRARNRPRS